MELGVVDLDDPIDRQVETMDRACRERLTAEPVAAQ